MRSEEEINAYYDKFESEIMEFIAQFVALAEKNRAYFDPIIENLSHNELRLEDVDPKEFAAISFIVRIFEVYRSDEKALKKNNVLFSENFFDEMAGFSVDAAIPHIFILRMERLNYIKEIKSCKEKVRYGHKLFAKKGRKNPQLARAVDGLAKLAVDMQKQVVICNLKIASLKVLIPDEEPVKQGIV